MKPFAASARPLFYHPQRNVKLRLLLDYFASAPDPDRGYALAALTGALGFRHAKRGCFATSRSRVATRSVRALL